MSSFFIFPANIVEKKASNGEPSVYDGIESENSSTSVNPGKDTVLQKYYHSVGSTEDSFASISTTLIYARLVLRISAITSAEDCIIVVLVPSNLSFVKLFVFKGDSIDFHVTPENAGTFGNFRQNVEIGEFMIV